MELIINDEKFKQLLKDAIIEMLQEDHEGFYEIIVEALEEIGMVNAMKTVKKGKFVGEEQIFDLLESQS